MPNDDLIEHKTEGTDCICGPSIELVEDEDGAVTELIIHHSLDGREKNER